MLGGARSAAPQQAQQAGGAGAAALEATGFDRPQGLAGAGAGVQDLGVVGRGRKRVNLAPMQAPQPDATAGTEGAVGGAAAADAHAADPPLEKKMRSMDELMGESPCPPSTEVPRTLRGRTKGRASCDISG